VPYRSTGSEPPIFSHGGSTHLADYLGETQPIYWLQVYGGDGTRVAPNIEAAAADYLAEIRRIQPRGPYHLMGYCLGALMVFEIAQQLSRQGEEIGLLALISPALPSFRESPSEVRTRKHEGRQGSPAVAAARAGILGRAGQLPVRIWRRVLWEKRRVKRWLCELWLSGGRPLPLGLRDFYLTETGNELISGYVPERYEGPVILFRSLQDGTEAQWRSVMPRVEFHNSWIDHNDFLEEPYVETLVAELREFRERVAQPARGTARNTNRVPVQVFNCEF
jgi:thioesterase domain-containing protein